MNRYRAKNANNVWVHGQHVCIQGHDFILQDEELHPANEIYADSDGVIDGRITPIISETLGEYSETPDKNGLIMCEGDIVNGMFYFGMSISGVVVKKDGTFGLMWQRGEVKEFNPFVCMCGIKYEIVGNIHDEKKERV